MDALIEAYAQGPAKLRQAVEGMSQQLLAFKPGPDRWSILEVVAHLADTEIVAVHRMNKVISEENPLLTAFDQDAWANRLRYRESDLNEHLALFELLRSRMTRCLRELSPEDWERQGTHSVTGAVTLRELVQKFTDHLDAHLAQIERNKMAYTAGC